MERLSAAIRECLRHSLIVGKDVSWRTSPDVRRIAPRGGSNRRSNATIKAELAELVKPATTLIGRLKTRSSETDQVLWMHAFFSKLDTSVPVPSDYRRFLAAASELEWLAGFLEDASAGIPRQPARWLETEQYERRVIHAYCLSSVFERSFELKAAVISWKGSPEGPWPDFFQRIMLLAFDEAKTPNIEKVLDEARRRHSANGVLFEPEKMIE